MIGDVGNAIITFIITDDYRVRTSLTRSHSKWTLEKGPDVPCCCFNLAGPQRAGVDPPLDGPLARWQ